MVIFRLTEDEYESLQAASNGSRSLSEFARARLMGSLRSTPLDAQITEIKTTVNRLAELLERS
ncbi:MAG: hypothetical protein LAO79_09330 [Acidobacteriia bacterium]|nr:hypothetical protein [Terriglobia bacterium]